MVDLLADSDVFVDHLRGARKFAPGADRVSYSVVTRCELCAGRATEEDRIRRLLAPFRELAVDRAVAERAGRLRRELGLRTPDALIAATAIEYTLVLLTRNRRDFESVPDLRLASPA